MKLNYPQIIVSIFILALSACKNVDPLITDETPPPVYWGEASASVNGEMHSCKSAASLFLRTGTIGITIDYEVIPNYLRHRVSIGYLPPILGDYLLQDRLPFVDTQPANVTFAWYSGDAIISPYQQLVDSTFELQITQLDTITNDISGTYAGTFIADILEPGNLAPDTIRIEHGTFKTKIGRQ